jgi:hypothetical protein
MRLVVQLDHHLPRNGKPDGRKANGGSWRTALPLWLLFAVVEGRPGDKSGLKPGSR